MGEIRTLLLLELRSLYGINKFRHEKDKKEKNRYRLLCVAVAFLILMLVFYVAGLVYGLVSLGLSKIVPTYLVTLASLLVLLFGIFLSGARIFGQKGYDILAAMPLRPFSILLTRFFSLYIEFLLLTCLIMLPGCVTYAVLLRPGLAFYPLALLGTLLIPAFPLALSTLLGTLTVALSSRMKHKSLWQTALLLGVAILTVAVGILLSRAEDITPDQLVTVGETVGSLLRRIYPPGAWLGDAMCGVRYLPLLLFVFLSLLSDLLLLAWVARYFHAILRRLQNFRTGQAYRIGRMERRTVTRALFLREGRRYFSSPIYVTNTIIGPLMGAILSVSLFFIDIGSVSSLLPGVDLLGLLPFLLSCVFSMMTTTSTAISMEGKQITVIRSLPIPEKALFDAKILLNLALMLPFYLFSVGAMAVAMRPSPLDFLFFLLIPAAIILFTVVLGITVNLRFHRFDWEKEETVVKQSLPAALGGFAGFFLSLLLGAAVFLTPPAYTGLTKAGICLLLFFGTYLLYRRNNRTKLCEL